MEKELIQFIKEYNISPFGQERITFKNNNSIFKTKEAKEIHSKILNKISSNFIFESTSKLFSFFNFTLEQNEIFKRQEFIKKFCNNLENIELKKLKSPKNFWKPDYNIIIVTENEKTFLKLQEMKCPARLLMNERDVLELETYDLVQVIDCYDFSSFLEELPQSFFVPSINEVYLERYLEELSGWKKNLEILKNIKFFDKTNLLVSDLCSLLKLIDKSSLKKISREEIEANIDKINEEISFKLREISISGDSLVKVLQKGILPLELQKIVDSIIEKYEIDHSILNRQFPVSIDEEELDKLLKKQNANEFTSSSEKIQKYSKELKLIPEKLEELSRELLFFDFIAGISKFIATFNYFPEIKNELFIEDVKNNFIENAQPISFFLDEKIKCSILTGANSGGKTTLLENIIQIISLTQLGFPVSGKVSIPLFSEIYYFAKSKGSANKGAFETLLSQMSEISPGNKTLILADEIEAITEPGVAGKVVAATSEYFIEKDCFLIIATHLGHELQHILPKYTRIDGIEAKGLDENFNLIVDHNPILGKLAHSTPELIIEKMANLHKKEYFLFIHKYLKKNN